MSNYYLYKVFYFSEIPAKIGYGLTDHFENEGGPCFGFIPFTIWSEEVVESMRKFYLHNPLILDVREYFIKNGAVVGETILIKF